MLQIPTFVTSDIINDCGLMYKKNTHTKAFPARDLHGMAFKPKPLARAFRFMLMASINVEKEVLGSIGGIIPSMAMMGKP